MTAAAPATDARGRLESGRVVRFALRLGVALLASGAQTTEVEQTIRSVTRGLGLPGVEAVVTYSTVTISFVAEGDEESTTGLQMVREWRTDFSRLAALASLARELETSGTGIEAAERELARIVEAGQPYGAILAFTAPALSAAAATILFGGSGIDALVTLVIALGIQPVLGWLVGGRMPPFFQTLVGVTATALVVVALAAFDLPIDGGLVLSGSLLRFLPGNALVSGMRDLIDGSTISGTAGLAEALLLGGAVAGGAGAALAIGADLGVTLSLSTDGRMAWPPMVLIAAAAASVAFYAIQLGVPRWALPGAIALGALAATVARGWVPGLPGGLVIVAAFLVGILARVIARRTRAPAALWAVPAILPLLPGLAIVSAMLAATSALRIAGLFEALVTGFAIGIGVGMGDVVTDTARRVRVGIVDPAVAAVTDGLGALIVSPSARRAAAGERPAAAADTPGADGRPMP